MALFTNSECSYLSYSSVLQLSLLNVFMLSVVMLGHGVPSNHRFAVEKSLSLVRPQVNTCLHHVSYFH
jgi:hypothetical protein